MTDKVVKKKENDTVISLETAFVKMEETIELLENDNITLEESFRLYQEGMKLIQICNEQIDTVEKKVMKLNEAGTLDEF